MTELFNRRNTGFFGLGSVIVLLISLLVFGNLNPDWSFLNDFISMLGAKGQPNAIWFNLIGFVLVGFLLFLFGLGYGLLLKDKLLAVLLSLFGIGFAFTAIPTDLELERGSAAKAHIVAICLSLAFWLFGLARMGSNKQLPDRVKYKANIASGMLALAMVGAATELYSMPFAHRLVFSIVFGWTAINSIELLSNSITNK